MGVTRGSVAQKSTMSSICKRNICGVTVWFSRQTWCCGFSKINLIRDLQARKHRNFTLCGELCLNKIWKCRNTSVVPSRVSRVRLHENDLKPDNMESRHHRELSGFDQSRVQGTQSGRLKWTVDHEKGPTPQTTLNQPFLKGILFSESHWEQWCWNTAVGSVSLQFLLRNGSYLAEQAETPCAEQKGLHPLE